MTDCRHRTMDFGEKGPFTSESPPYCRLLASLVEPIPIACQRKYQTCSEKTCEIPEIVRQYLQEQR